MAIRSTSTRFGAIAQLFHWLIVGGILVEYLLAENAEETEHIERAAAATWSTMDWHRSIGLTLLGLALLRLLWRLVDRRPAWPNTMKRYERVVARIAHVAFYGLLVAVPLAGWAYSSADGDRIQYFGLFDVPALVVSQRAPEAPAAASIATDDERGEQLEELHELLFNALALLALFHVLAALKHHFWNRDTVLRSMLPGGHRDFPTVR